MYIYKISLRGILSYLGWPLFYAIAFFSFSFLKSRSFSFFLDTIWMIFGALYIFISSIGSIFLLVNHYVFFRNTIIEYDNLSEEVLIKDLANSIKFKKSEISLITKYRAGFYSHLPWSEICIWEIRLKESIIILAPIVITKSNFIKVFNGVHYEKKYKLFVRLYKK